MSLRSERSSSPSGSEIRSWAPTPQPLDGRSSAHAPGVLSRRPTDILPDSTTQTLAQSLESSPKPPDSQPGIFHEPSQPTTPQELNTAMYHHENDGVGAEPGIDPRRDSTFAHFSHIHQDCVIDVIDYSSAGGRFLTKTNQEFVEMMKDSVQSKREDWAIVRWINIGGISWDVISAVALRYDLHSLALEDIVKEQGHNHSKADYYQAHLFLRVLCHSLATGNEPISSAAPLYSSTLGPSRSYVDPENVDTSGDPNNASTMRRVRNNMKAGLRNPFGTNPRQEPRHVFSGLSGVRSPARSQRQLQIEELKKGNRVNVKVAPMFIFLLRDGTVISIHPSPTREFTAPIISRLRQNDTVLRTSADPSLLVESLLDLIVDRVLEVVDQFQDHIYELEQAILLKASMHIVRRLHILSGDLILHKRTIAPIKTMIYGLRRYDVDRSIALANMYRDPISGRKEHNMNMDPGDTGAVDTHKVQGYMSYNAKIYLADVYDHMDFVLTSLDMFEEIAENLINYAFNTASYDMNQVMRRLTLTTTIFLPLTLLTGYFGMNFTSFWSINHNSDLLFWIISLPILAVAIPVFMYQDIVKVFRHLKDWVLVPKSTPENHRR